MIREFLFECPPLCLTFVGEMDPLAGLSVVGNVIQIIDFSAKVISISAEIYDSGGLVGNSELRRVTVDLLSFSQKLDKSLGTVPNASPSDAAEKALSKDCQRVASELLFTLEKIKSKTNLGSGMVSVRPS